MLRIVKRTWVRRKPTTKGFVLTLEAERERQKQERIAHVKSLVGSTERLPGTVCRIEKYGAFAKFNWGEGLIHISEISKNRIRHPNEVVSPGQRVHLYVQSVDDKGRISLSLVRPGKKNLPQLDQPTKVTPEYKTINTQEDATPDSQLPILSSEVIDGKMPLRGFAELTAYWKLKEDQ